MLGLQDVSLETATVRLQKQEDDETSTLRYPGRNLGTPCYFFPCSFLSRVTITVRVQTAGNNGPPYKTWGKIFQQSSRQKTGRKKLVLWCLKQHVMGQGQHFLR